MPFRRRFKPLLFLATLALIVGQLACGGGGGGGGEATPTPSGTPTPTPIPTGRAFFELSWSARSRAVATAPSSARSARVTISGAGGTASVSVDRATDPAAYTQRYETAQALPLGSFRATLEFFADPGASGPVVASGSADFTLAADGSGLGTIATSGAVRSVEIPVGQSVPYGVKRDLFFTARDASGAILALSPGSAFASATAGSERIRLARGVEVEGVRPGLSQVTISIDGVTSPPVSVSVLSDATIQVLPARIEVGAGKQTSFTANLFGAAEPGVDWSAPAGGAIDAAGTFTAPTIVGEYLVVATSRWDTSKSAQGVAVVVPSVSLSPGNTQVTTLRKQLTFSATVVGPTDKSVTWSIVEASGGTVSNAGVYTAPATPGNYTVVATSVADPRQKASVSVQVKSGSGGITIQ